MQAIPTFPKAIAAAFLLAAAAPGAILCSVTAGAHAQNPAPAAGAAPAAKPKPQKLQPHAELSVTKAQYSADGILVLGVRITAKDKDVALGTAGDGSATGNDSPFSMEGCYLENEETKEHINALPDTPNTPNFGPMVLLTQVAKGTWIELGVAFPRLPSPKDPTKPDTYKLYVPLKSEPVEIKQLPEPPPPKPKPKPAVAPR